MIKGFKKNGEILQYDYNALGNLPSNTSLVEPMEDDIPKVFFGEALPQTKDDVIMKFRYISKTMDINGYCKTKAQGSSSMSYPKKNQTVKLYKDSECSEKLKVNFKNWGEQNKFCFKANWIDITHSRNIVSARLWGDVVKTRSNYSTIPVELQTSPNQGAVDGFLVKVYAGGVYQGRYTLNVPKDAWMANMDDSLDSHCILCGENYFSGCFRTKAKIDDSDWSDEVHDTVPLSIKTRWNECIDFVMNSTDKEFVEEIGNYFDLESLIDYYCYGVAICNLDGFGKNQIFMTYDGLKFFASAYDLDCTFGTYLTYMKPHDFPRSQFEDFNASYQEREGNLLFIRIEKLFVDAIKNRYFELRKHVLSCENVINRFERFVDICPPHLVEEDYAETTMGGSFSEIPLKAENNIQQIRKYAVDRFAYTDDFISKLGDNPNLVYKLSTETTFDGTDDYIDTGIKLFDEAKDFTIVFDVTDENDLTTRHRLMGCRSDVKDSEGLYVGGFSVVTSISNPWYNVASRPNATDGGQQWFNGELGRISITDRVKVVLVFKDGVASYFSYKLANNTNMTTVDALTDIAYKQHDKTLLVGADRFYDTDTISDYWKGTVHSLEVYDIAMSKEEATVLLNQS